MIKARPALPLLELQKAPAASDDRFAKKESTLKREKLERYAGTCSEVLPKFLYVGGEIVARDADILAAHGITHVLNAAGCSVPSAFPNRFEYLTLEMHDDGLVEDVTWFASEAAEFLEKCWDAGGRCLVHCSRGVSRSCALAIAYLMVRSGAAYRDAYAAVRLSRPICEPNAGFAAQLMAWGDRRAAGDDSGGRLYRAVAHHSGRAVSRLCGAPASGGAADYGQTLPPRACHLDPRRAFVVVRGRKAAVWVGGLVDDERFVQCALDCARRLQRFDGVVCCCSGAEHGFVREGAEPDEFWELVAEDAAPPANDAAAPSRTISPVAVYDADDGLALRPARASPGAAAADGSDDDAAPPRDDDERKRSKGRAAPLAPPAPAARVVSDGPESRPAAEAPRSPSPKGAASELYELSDDGARQRWDRCVDYDHECLESTSLCWLHAGSADFIWVGADFAQTHLPMRCPERAAALARQVAAPKAGLAFGAAVAVVWEREETPAFWRSFELGY
ncbi:hypothetical protein M885DRAFT_512700 [Pelagophyceae sp. CCMP2097]|nr:hypothetical protein M885DRAFT_512700 [Pelagophyceae sp. CCMP2097]